MPDTPEVLQMVHVRWRDSVRIYDGWDSVEHYREADHSVKATCDTVGWLVRDNEDGVVICLSRSSDSSDVSDGMFIPRTAIIEMGPVSAPGGNTLA